jgi:hypothetical protein
LDHRHDIIGYNSVLGPATPPGAEPFDVRLRIACRVRTRDETESFAHECQDMWWAPGVGGGGVRTFSRAVLGMHSASVDRGLVTPQVTVTQLNPDRVPLCAPG